MISILKKRLWSFWWALCISQGLKMEKRHGGRCTGGGLMGIQVFLKSLPDHYHFRLQLVFTIQLVLSWYETKMKKWVTYFTRLRFNVLIFFYALYSGEGYSGSQGFRLHQLRAPPPAPSPAYLWLVNSCLSESGACPHTHLKLCRARCYY